MTHLLDTNACVNHLRDPFGLVAGRLAALPAGQVAVCSVVVAELLRGVRLSRDPAHGRAVVDEFLAQFVSLPFDDPAADEYARVRVALEAAGVRLDHADLMIAAIALTHGLTLVTHNTQHLNRVPGLRVEDWQVP